MTRPSLSTISRRQERMHLFEIVLDQDDGNALRVDARTMVSICRDASV